MSMPGFLSSLNTLQECPLAVEATGLDAGEAWMTTRLAGLQFYSYNQSDGLEGAVRPQFGDRLHLMRRPDNRADKNAVEIWWKNEFMIGHLPAHNAEEVAPLMDAGKALRAYVSDPGDGRAWSLEAILIGPAAEAQHTRWLEAEASGAMHEIYGPKYPRQIKRLAAMRFEDYFAQGRTTRLRDAVEVLSTVPFSPDLPPAGESTTVEGIAAALGIGTGEAIGFVESAGIRAKARINYGKSQWRSIRISPRLAAAIEETGQRPSPVATWEIPF